MAKPQQRSRKQSPRRAPTDVDGILKQAEANRAAANKPLAAPYEPHWGWGYERSTSRPQPVEPKSLEQRAAESYVAGNRPAPQGFKSARERKAAKAQAAARAKQNHRGKKKSA